MKSGDKKFYYAIYDYGMGGLHYFIYARSKDEIKAKFPERQLFVYSNPPHKPTHFDLAFLAHSHCLDIDNLNGPNVNELCEAVMSKIIGWDVFKAKYYDPNKDWQDYLNL